MIATVEELLTAALALEVAAARRYRYLAAWWEAQGDRDLTALFDRLAELEQEHATAVLGRGLGVADTLHPAATDLPPGEDVAWQSALLTPYRALAFAVREEQRAFAFYAEVAAYAATPALRALAEDLARDELEHAAILRRARRAAFRNERRREKDPPPADAAALQRQSVVWETEAMATSGRAARMFALSCNAERYLDIAEQTKDEAMLAAAQRLAAQTLQRLAAMRGGSGAS